MLRKLVFLTGVSTGAVALLSSVTATDRNNDFPVLKQCNLKTSAHCEKSQQLTLKLVQVIFRHGARNPLKNPTYIPSVEYTDDIITQNPNTFIPYEVVGLDGKKMVDAGSHELVDSNENEKKKNGQLTRLGSEQTHQLGCRLRERYVNKLQFISKYYNDEVQVRSTGVQRAMDSARCVLSGNSVILLAVQ